MPGLRAESATYTYPGATAPALHPLSLTIQPGTTVALLGPNGSGKSTLLHLLARLRTPTTGAITGGPSHPADHAFVAQTNALDPILTVRENLHLAARLLGRSRTDTRARAHELAHRFHLADRLDHRVATLSGGLARRTDIARALLADPTWRFLDEPTTGLDLDARRDLIDDLLDATDQRTTVLATHRFDEAARADHAYLFAKGALVADGSPASLTEPLAPAVIEYDAPAHTLPEPIRARAVTTAATRALVPAVTNPAEWTTPAVDAGIRATVAPPTLEHAYALALANAHHAEPSP